MSKQSGINKDFLYLTANFRKEYEEASKDVAASVLAGRIVSKALIDEKVVKALGDIIEDYFQKSISTSNKIVKAEVSRLTNQLEVPFKYNKDLLSEINDKSVFSGYYDTNVKSSFKKKEILKLQKTILSAKYGDWTERETISAIKNVVNVTDNNARVIARSESTRLSSVANQIYYGKKAVRDKYNLVFHSYPDARPVHKSYDGQIADENGYFHGDCGAIKGPPVSCSPWNCRCTTELELKQ